MKALVYTGPAAIELQDVPEPSAGVAENLVRIDSVGICGSDMHAFLGHDDRRPAPLILGHEAAGVIADGPGTGRRVTINPLVTCGKCPVCLVGRENLCSQRQIISMPPRPGVFAQFVSMPDVNLIDVPDHVPLEKAALAEPLAVGWHAARLALKALRSGNQGRALVIGGGAIGLASALALRSMGVNEIVVCETDESRRRYLNVHCGVNAVGKVEKQFAVILDAVGFSGTRALASAVAEPGGVIAHIGLGEDLGGLDVRRMTLQEITFIGTYTYSRQDFEDTAQAMFEGRLGTLDWAETRALNDGVSAFHDLRNGRVAAPKIILKPES